MPTFRLFVSSPRDTTRERQCVERVAARLNAEFAGTARLDVVRWETQFYQAFATFQSQIALSADCDLVVAIFRARLGTELPSGFEMMPDGTPYPSGTAYEVLTAIDKRQRGAELPDIYVFRYPDPPSITLDDEDAERSTREQWERLKAFFARWFMTPQGHFKAAFQTFASPDDFEAQVERLLREWLAHKVARGRAVQWPLATKGSPFPGLRAFGARHAPVFCGRTRDVVRAVDQWRTAAARGARFLLIAGASGTGKSSLARAGLLPRFIAPGVVAEIEAWRVAVMRPSDSAAGPIATLAQALMQAEPPTDEEGRPPALPEIAEGAFKSSEELAALLAHADASSTKPVLAALARAGEIERDREGLDRSVRCDLALLVDQLDEIFAVSVTPQQRTAFARCLLELAMTGRVWIVATLRADLYEDLLREPALFELKEQGATLDLAAPGMAELAEIVRKPAQAAGLSFETDPTSGQSVDERLLADADRPDMLPLVQLALSRLYDAREAAGDDVRLTFKAYAELGGISGIIDKVGEEAVSRLDAAEQARLPRLLRLLAERARESDSAAAALTARSVSLAEATHDGETKRLIVALTGARLLTTTGESIRLAHQRVLSDWTRARQIVTESAEFYRIRDEVEAQRAKWQAAGRRAELLLRRGLPLSEAESIVSKYGEEMSPAALAFVTASRRRANLGFVLTAAAAVLFALVAVGAGIAAKLAIDERARAEANFDAAKRAVDGLIYSVAQGLQDVSGMRVETVRKVLDTVRATVDDLVKTAPGHPGLLRSRVTMLNNFVDTYLKAGDLQNAFNAGNEGLTTARALTVRDPTDGEALRLLCVSLYKLGDVRLRANDVASAMALYQESLAEANTLVARNRGDSQARRVLWVSTVKTGDGKYQARDFAGARAAYQSGLELARARPGATRDDPEARRDLSISFSKLGDAKLAEGDHAGALESYRESLAVRRALAQYDRDNAQAQRDVALDLNKIGAANLEAGDREGAIAALDESLAIFRSLAAQDRGNARAQRDVAVSLNNIGDLKAQDDDQVGALAAYQESLGIVRALAALDQGNDQAKIEVAITLVKVASVAADAAALYREALAVLEPLDVAGKLSSEQHDLIAFIIVELSKLPAR